MRAAFHERLDSLTETLSHMCGLAGVAMERATTAVLHADLQAAEAVIADHEDLTAMQTEAEEAAFLLLALQAPVAADLRVVVGSMQNVADAERMGGLARHVAEIARRRHPDRTVPPEVSDVFADMGRIAVDLGNSAQVVVQSRDPRQAAQIRRDDIEMDELHQHLFTPSRKRTGLTASRPPWMSPCWAGSTNASPTMPSRLAVESSSRQPGKPPTLESRQQPIPVAR
jgi:phosphate transport system protein